MSGYLQMVRLDCYTMKSQVIVFLAMIAIVTNIGVMGSTVTVMSITGSWFTALLSSNVFAIQEKNGLHRLYGSLSISLNNIVLGRYLFYHLCYCLSFVTVMAVYVCMTMYLNKALEWPDILLGFSLSLLIFSMITGIQAPMYFKMGYTKARIWSMVPFAGLICLMAIAVSPSFAPALSGYVDAILSHRIILVVIGIVTSCAIQVLSYRFAVAAYRKRW